MFGSSASDSPRSTCIFFWYVGGGSGTPMFLCGQRTALLVKYVVVLGTRWSVSLHVSPLGSPSGRVVSKSWVLLVLRYFPLVLLASWCANSFLLAVRVQFSCSLDLK